MRVAIVHEHVDARRGGAETSVLEMASALCEMGVEVTIVCAAASDESRETAADHERAFNVQRIEVARGSRLARTVAFVGGADTFCRSEAFDIVHAVTPCFSCNVYQPRGGTYVETVNRSVALARTGCGRMIRRLARRWNRRQRFLLLVEREILSDARAPFVAPGSEYVRRHVLRAFPNLPPDRVRVVFNAVRHRAVEDDVARLRSEQRDALNIDSSERLLLFVAHNFKLKGLSELLRAGAAPNASASWRIVVVGRDRPPAYQRLARRLGLADRVSFLGSAKNMWRLYAAADLLVHPTWYDPCSRVVLEALCAGLPVVTTRYNGASEIIDPARHGGVVDEPADAGLLAREIARCLGPGLRAACVADAQRLQDLLSTRRHAEALCVIYAALASGAS